MPSYSCNETLPGHHPSCFYLSRDMTKPTKWLCAQRRLSLGSRPVWSVFAVHMKKASVLSYPLSAQRSLWSDWADTQADQSLRWAHTHFVSFVMSWHISSFHVVLFQTIYDYCSVLDASNSRMSEKASTEVIYIYIEYWPHSHEIRCMFCDCFWTCLILHYVKE